MVDPRAALMLAVDILVLGLVIWWPLGRSFDHSDKGTGNRIDLPPPLTPSWARATAFLLICALVCAWIISFRKPSLTDAYQNLIGMVVISVVHEPAVVGAYIRFLTPLVPISIIAYVISLAIVLPATFGRRVMILLHGALFLAAAVTSDATLAVIGIATGLPLGPYPVVSVLMHYTIGFFVVFRLAFTTFQLPRRTDVPLFRRGNLADDLLVLLAAGTGFALAGAAGTVVINHFPSDVAVRVVVIVAVPAYAFMTMYAFLGILRLLGPPLPRVTEERPPVDLIVAAYNEEANIAALLGSIDAAARVYGGRVHAIVCDDGSTDRTRERAERAIAAFKAASGEIINGLHSGKSTALNQALERCTADYVVRIDGDCLLDDHALLYTVPWFLTRPNVGLVGAFTLPKRPYTTWIDRIRAFGLCQAFGFTRLCSAVVDGIPCIPGTYVAFRRQLALRIGGFVEGCYGEDVDFTCNIARLGYRAAVDRRIMSYEDVPNTTRQLRRQRVRWNRGGTYTYARHTPFGAGLAGPRMWLTATRGAGKRLTGPIHLVALIYAVDTAFLSPSSQHNPARVVAVFLLAMTPPVLIKVIVAAYYRHTRELPWLVFLPWYSLLVRLFMLDALLSFRTRPLISRFREPKAVLLDPAPATEPRYLPAIMPEGALYSPPASSASLP
jgi:cellulose synthase/poly-beta-1,6-N-acetylglucosamine synthase-like glycosyltransferase